MFRLLLALSFSINLIQAEPVFIRNSIVIEERAKLFTEIENFELANTLDSGTLTEILEESNVYYCFLQNESLFSQHEGKDANSLCEDNSKPYPFYKVQIGRVTGWVFGKSLGISIHSPFQKNLISKEFKQFHNQFLNKSKTALIWFVSCSPSSSQEFVSQVICAVLKDSKGNHSILDIGFGEGDYPLKVYQHKIPEEKDPILAIEYFNKCETDECHSKRLVLFKLGKEVKKVFSQKTISEKPNDGRLEYASVGLKKDQIAMKLLKLESTQKDELYNKVGVFKKIFQWDSEKQKFGLKSKIKPPVTIRLKRTARLFSEPDLKSEKVKFKRKERFKVTEIQFVEKEKLIRWVRAESEYNFGWFLGTQVIFDDPIFTNLKTKKLTRKKKRR
ncbi:MAG: hypothetical protein SFU98_08855 [Leptospiraceae bacterium]|nr:hypothetical protein [Leptospiraceae bacterium]